MQLEEGFEGGGGFFYCGGGEDEVVFCIGDTDFVFFGEVFLFFEVALLFEGISFKVYCLLGGFGEAPGFDSRLFCDGFGGDDGLFEAVEFLLQMPESSLKFFMLILSITNSLSQKHQILLHRHPIGRHPTLHHTSTTPPTPTPSPRITTRTPPLSLLLQTKPLLLTSDSIFFPPLFFYLNQAPAFKLELVVSFKVSVIILFLLECLLGVGELQAG